MSADLNRETLWTLGARLERFCRENLPEPLRPKVVYLPAAGPPQRPTPERLWIGGFDVFQEGTNWLVKENDGSAGAVVGTEETAVAAAFGALVLEVDDRLFDLFRPVFFPDETNGRGP